MSNTATTDPFGLKVPLKKLVERLAAAESSLQTAAGREAEGVVDAHGHYHLLREAQTALRQSEARFRGLIEHSSDVIALLGADGTITYDSPAVRQVLGYTQAELVGQNAFTHLHPGDMNRVKIAFTKLLATPSDSFHEQVRFRHQNGSYRWLEGTATNLLHEPAVKAIVLNYRDITERVHAERALRDSELKFRNVVQALPAAVYTCDAHGRITLFNQAAVALWGREPEPGPDRWCGSWKIYGLDGARILHDACPMAVAIKQGAPVRNCEIIIERPDGTRRNVLSYPEPIFDDAGRVVGGVKMLVDVTDRKRAEIERERFFTLSPDLLCIVGADGYFIRLNPAFGKTLGYTEAEARAQPFFEFVHPDDRANTLAMAAQVQTGKPLHNFENRYRCKDGSYRWIEWVATPYPADGTRYAVGRDITQRKLTEATLRESQQRLELALKSADLGIWELDLANDTSRRTLRHDQIFGYATLQPAWGGAIFLQHVFPDDRAEAEQSFQRAMATGHFQLQCRIVWPDGSLHWLSAEGRVFHDDRGAPTRIVGVNADITERKLAELEIRNQLSELRRWQDVTLGREARVLALKAEVNQLLAKQNQPPRYAGPAA